MASFLAPASALVILVTSPTAHTVTAIRLVKNLYFSMIFSPKYSYWSLLSNEVSYDVIQIIFHKLDFFSGGSPRTPRPPPKNFCFHNVRYDILGILAKKQRKNTIPSPFPRIMKSLWVDLQEKCVPHFTIFHTLILLAYFLNLMIFVSLFPLFVLTSYSLPHRHDSIPQILDLN